MRAGAAGVYADEAAVELLIGHQWWLRRDDFAGVFVETDVGLSGVAMAWVDWQAAVGALDDAPLACSGSEAQVLRVAASLAEGVPVDLRDAVSSLDAVNIVVVVRAVLHAAGHRDASVTLGGVARW